MKLPDERAEGLIVADNRPADLVRNILTRAAPHHRLVLMKINSIIVLATSLSFSACGGSNPADQKSSPGAKPAATATAPAATPEPPPAAPPAASNVDLGAAGPGWAGFTVKAPEGTTIADNGAGGAVVMTKDFQFDLSTEPFDAKLRKEGLQFGVEASKGKITYAVDKADELAWTSERPNADGAPMKSFGFAMVVSAGDKKVTCFAPLDTEEQVKAAREICTSLSKKG
jgi:hypothetical protein